MDELRKDERFRDYGRVECGEICALPGILCDVSQSGLKAAFCADVSMSMDDEYRLRLRIPGGDPREMRLLAAPAWRSDEPRTGRTHIGFALLRAWDFPRFRRHVGGIEESSDEFFGGAGECDEARAAGAGAQCRMI